MAEPVHSAGTDNSFSGAIMALMHALIGAAAPRSVTDRGYNVNAAVNGQPSPMQQGTMTSAQPATLLPQGLGHEFYQNADQ